MQFSERVRNARSDAIQATIGASAKLLFFSSAKPANCAAADPAGLIDTLDLPATWLDDATAGLTAKLGTWSGTATGTGQIRSFRIKDNSLANCDVQGTCTVVDGGGEMELEEVDIVPGREIVVRSFAMTEGNA